ncbi:MAG: P1 family peptidase [Gaiellaceae bacterium]
MRARELGITLGELEPGPLNAITDVEGIRVGHSTIVRGDDVRTGVTVVVPAELPAFAAPFRLNGNGEMTGLEWVRESGFLTTPVAITNTNSVGVVRDALVAAALDDPSHESPWSLPVVAETWDGRLNDINGFHVSAEHLREALSNAAGGAVPEGNVGGGTGMVSHGFKGGIGTSSRIVEEGHTVGVLVQANHGARRRLIIDGVPVGAELGPERIPLPTGEESSSTGSIIVVVATDAPLLPHQCDRLARRAALAIGRTGGAGETSSGDLVLAFATGNRSLESDGAVDVTMLAESSINQLFYASIEATEEAIVNALLAAETMSGRGATVHRLDPEQLREVMRAHGRGTR